MVNKHIVYCHFKSCDEELLLYVHISCGSSLMDVCIFLFRLSLLAFQELADKDALQQVRDK